MCVSVWSVLALDIRCRHILEPMKGKIEQPLKLQHTEECISGKRHVRLEKQTCTEPSLSLSLIILLPPIILSSIYLSICLSVYLSLSLHICRRSALFGFSAKLLS